MDGACIDAHIAVMRQDHAKARGDQVQVRHSRRQITMRAVRSSSIAAAGYDPVGRTLRIRFIGGDAYDYQSVPADVFRGFLDAPSKGRFVNWQVKPYFRYRRVSS